MRLLTVQQCSWLPGSAGAHAWPTHAFNRSPRLHRTSHVTLCWALPQGPQAPGAEDLGWDARDRQAVPARDWDARRIQISLQRAGLAAVQDRLAQLEPAALVDLLRELEKVRSLLLFFPSHTSDLTSQDA